MIRYGDMYMWFMAFQQCSLLIGYDRLPQPAFVTSNVVTLPSYIQL